VAALQHTFTHKQYTEQHKNFGRVWTVPRLGELYPGICLTTEEKAWKTPQSVKESHAEKKRRLFKNNCRQQGLRLACHEAEEQPTGGTNQYLLLVGN